MHIKKTFSFYALREVMPLNNSLKNDTDDDTFDLESATQTDIEARGGGTWVFFGWVCAARDSKMAPRSGKNFP